MNLKQSLENYIRMLKSDLEKLNYKVQYLNEEKLSYGMKCYYEGQILQLELTIKDLEFKLELYGEK